MGQGKQRVFGKRTLDTEGIVAIEGEIRSPETATVTSSKNWLHPQTETDLATPKQGHGNNADCFLSSGPLKNSQ